MITSYGTIKLGRQWGIIQCDHQLGKYLRKLAFSYLSCKLQRPSHDDHITFISSYDNIDLLQYQDWDGEIIKFSLDLSPQTNGNAIWIPAYSIQAGKIRLTFGLKEFQDIPLHFCIGYFKQGKNYDSRT